MADWANIAYGAEMGIDAFQQQETQRRALDAGSQMFAGIGTEEAMGFAQLMRDNPDDAAMMAAQFGGLPSLYETFKANAGLSIDPIAFANAQSTRITANAAMTRAEAETANAPGEMRIKQQNADAATLRAQRTGLSAGQPKPQAPTVIEGNLRSDFMREDPNYDVRMDAVASANRAYAESGDHRAADIALIYSFIKLRDPNAVREGEVALLNTAGGLGGAVATAAQFLGANNGGVMAPGMRDAVMKQIQSEWRYYKKKRQSQVDRYRSRAEQVGVEPDQVAIWQDPDELVAAPGAPKERDTTPPPGLPEGSSFGGHDETGRRVFIGPDGTYYTEK